MSAASTMMHAQCCFSSLQIYKKFLIPPSTNSKTCDLQIALKSYDLKFAEQCSRAYRAMFRQVRSNALFTKSPIFETKRGNYCEIRHLDYCRNEI